MQLVKNGCLLMKKKQAPCWEPAFILNLTNLNQDLI